MDGDYGLTSPLPQEREHFSIDQLIEEAEREIALRLSVYPRRIASGHMRRSVAIFHLDRMRAVLRNLQHQREGGHA